jgi:hypothetical protein
MNVAVNMEWWWFTKNWKKRRIPDFNDRKRENKHRADAAEYATQVAGCSLATQNCSTATQNCSLATQKLKYQDELFKALQTAESTADVHCQNGTEAPGRLAKYISHLSDKLDKCYDCWLKST